MTAKDLTLLDGNSIKLNSVDETALSVTFKAGIQNGLMTAVGFEFKEELEVSDD